MEEEGPGISVPIPPSPFPSFPTPPSPLTLPSLNYSLFRLEPVLTFAGLDDTEYVDGGLYATETPGAGGAAYTAGRGGAGNVGRGTDSAVSDRRDSINKESVVAPPKEGEGYSTGRGGRANVHPEGAPKETRSESTALAKEHGMSSLGLAYVSWGEWGADCRDKLKFKLFGKKAHS